MSKHYLTWDSTDVAHFVAKIGNAFVPLSKELKDAGVTGGFLPSITDTDLLEMGVESETQRNNFRARVSKLVDEHEKLKRRSNELQRTRHKRHPQRRPPIIHIPDRGSQERSPPTASDGSPSRSSKRRRDENWVYIPNSVSHSLPRVRRRSPRQVPLPSTPYSVSPTPSGRAPRRHIALRISPRSSNPRTTTKPVIDPNHHLLANVSPREHSEDALIYGRSRVIAPRRQPASLPSSPRGKQDAAPSHRKQTRPHSTSPTLRQSRYHHPPRPVISASRTGPVVWSRGCGKIFRRHLMQIRKPRPYAISMKATLVDSPKKKTRDSNPKITIINLEKNPPSNILERKDATLPDSWFGKQGKGIANSSNTSLLSSNSGMSRSSASDPSSAMDSGSSGLSRSLESSISTIATIIEEERSFTDIDEDMKICDVLRQPQIGGTTFEDNETSSKIRKDCDYTEQSDQLTFAPSNVDELELNAVEITIQRPKNAEEAFLEFSNAIAICVCSLQLGHEYLELLYQISDRLYGREQVNYDLSQGTITRNLASNYEFLQLLNLLGFELEGKMLICRQKPPERVLRVFQKYIREYQYAGFDTYCTKQYVDILDENALKMLQIVMAVTHDNAQTNEDLTQSFVAFMPYLCDVHSMLELLQFWYDQCVSHFENPSNVKSAIATLLKHLIEHYKYEVFASPVYQSLVERIQEDDPVSYTHIESVIREANSNVQTLPFLLQNTISTVSNLFDLSPQMLADNLTLSNFNLFTSIPLVDFFEQNLITSKLAEFKTRYENIQRWVMITIYGASSSEERGSRIRTFFKVAERMKQNQDVFGFFAIFRALHSPEVQSFETAWNKQVFVKKFRSKRDYSKIWVEWKAICTKAGKARELFWKSRPPSIPSIYVISAYMNLIYKYQERSRDAVELFCQLRQLYPFVKKLRTFQKVHYSLKADISVINALEAEFLAQSKMNLWSVRSMYIKALNADSIPIPSDILTKMNRPVSTLRKRTDDSFATA